jgi:nucleoside-diphosphate-sugar epimerase
MTGEEPVTIEHYAGTVARLLGLTGALKALDQPASGSVTSKPLPADFAYMLMGNPAHPHRCYDNGKVRSAIGPYARWSLSRGLAATLQWYWTMRGLSAEPASQAA